MQKHYALSQVLEIYGNRPGLHADLNFLNGGDFGKRISGNRGALDTGKTEFWNEKSESGAYLSIGIIGKRGACLSETEFQTLDRGIIPENYWNLGGLESAKRKISDQLENLWCLWCRWC
jgi:hypothetical protein